MTTTGHIARNSSNNAGDTYCGLYLDSLSFTGIPDCTLAGCDCMNNATCESCILLYFEEQARDNDA